MIRSSRARSALAIGAVALLTVAPSTAVLGSATAAESPSPTATATATATAKGQPSGTDVGPITDPQPPLVNEQLVVATLAASGLPLTVQLINRLVATDLPPQSVTAQTSTTQVRQLDKAQTPQVTGNTVTYQVGGPGQTSQATQADFTKPLPVALHAEYATPGDGAEGIDPDTVAKATGDMAVRYTITNTVVDQQDITYKNAAGKSTTEKLPVFAPFVGTLISVLAPSVHLVDGGTAVVGTTQDGRTSLQWNLVLYPPMGNYQQQLDFKVTGDPLEVPSVNMEVIPVRNGQDPSVAFSANLLSESVKGNEKLAGGLGEINEQTLQLAEGASKVAAGTAEVVQNVQTAATGSDQLQTQGSAPLASGLVQVSNGLTELLEPANLPATVPGIEKVQAGLATAVAALGKASDPPLPPIDPKNPVFPPKMTVIQAVQVATDTLALLAKADKGGAALSTASASQIDEVIAANCPGALPEADCTKLREARLKTLGARDIAAGTAYVLNLLSTKLLTGVRSGLLEISVGLRSFSNTNPGAYEGLGQIATGLEQSIAALNKIATGLASAETGSAELNSKLQELATGLQRIATGAEPLETGSDAVANGASELQKQGTEKVYDSVVDSSSTPAKADAYLKAASARADQAAPYPAPEGAVARVAYIFTLTPPVPQDGPSPYALAIAGIFALALCIVAIRRIRSPAGPPAAAATGIAAAPQEPADLPPPG